jgi:SpoVK/Ycf46/Vps4 family AAA+-type ATPase
MILFFDDIDQLLVDGSNDPESEQDARLSSRGKVLCDFMEDLIYQLKPNRSMFLIGTAVRDSPLLSRVFIHKERLPTHLTSADREALLGDKDVDPSEKYSFMELVELARTGNDNRELRRSLMANQSAADKKVMFQSTARLGGLSAQIRTLNDAISLPLQFPFLFRGNKTLASSGAFVIGPSGAGKSALVDHVVRQLNLPVEIVRGPDLLDKYIGASEQAVRKVFEKAASIAPCVVVFDTIDALCPRRGAESTGVTDRVVNQMLCYLDGIDKVENVFVIATSSRPDMVDPALTRPGRLDLVIVCDLPTLEEKEEILAALWEDYMGECPDKSMIEEIAASLDSACTGADIKAGFVNAKIIASRTSSEVTVPLLVQCMRELKPSISPRDAAHYKEVLGRYKGESVEFLKPDLVGTRVMLH